AARDQQRRQSVAERQLALAARLDPTCRELRDELCAFGLAASEHDDGSWLHGGPTVPRDCAANGNLFARRDQRVASKAASAAANTSFTGTLLRRAAATQASSSGAALMI